MFVTPQADPERFIERLECAPELHESGRTIFVLRPQSIFSGKCADLCQVFVARAVSTRKLLSREVFSLGNWARASLFGQGHRAPQVNGRRDLLVRIRRACVLAAWHHCPRTAF